MLMGSACEAIPFAQFVNLGVEQPSKKIAPSGTRKHTKTTVNDLVQEFPWLADLDKSEGFALAEGAADAGASSSLTASEPEHHAVGDEEELTRAMRELDQKRAELASQGQVDSDGDFKVGVLGGAWTLAAKGKVADAIQGVASSVLARDFCTARQIQKSIRFDIEAYGPEICGILARAWCHRMQYFLNAELRDPVVVGRKFGREIVADYEEPSEMAKLAADPESSSGKLDKRIRQVRSFFDQ